MNLPRRHFLTGSASAALVASTARIPAIWAETGVQAHRARGENILVVIQLSGGNDGLNTVIPYGDDAYHKNRFATRVDAKSVLRIDDYLGWHPALARLADLQSQSRLAIVQGVGYPNPNRSHFESMDIWHSARLQPPHRTGWIGRWLDATAASPSDESAAQQTIRALHIGDEPLPLAVSGLNVMVPSLRTIESLRVTGDGTVRDALRSIEGNARVGGAENKHELLEFVRATRDTALAAAKRLEAIASEPAKGYDGSALAQKLASVAQLIAVDFGPRVYYVEISGFDTHSQQPAAHEALLTEVSKSISAFHADLDSRSLSGAVATLCFSEFGRRVRENGSRGTDHGTAAPLFIAGPRGLPTLLGKYPSLVDLDEGDLKHTVDFRGVYATVLERWLGVASPEILGESFPLLPLWG